MRFGILRVFCDPRMTIQNKKRKTKYMENPTPKLNTKIQHQNLTPKLNTKTL